MLLHLQILFHRMVARCTCKVLNYLEHSNCLINSFYDYHYDYCVAFAFTLNSSSSIYCHMITGKFLKLSKPQLPHF